MCIDMLFVTYIYIYTYVYHTVCTCTYRYTNINSRCMHVIANQKKCQIVPCLNPSDPLRTCEGRKNGLLLSQLVSALLALLKTFTSSNAKFSGPAKHDIQHDMKNPETTFFKCLKMHKYHKKMSATATQITQHQAKLSSRRRQRTCAEPLPTPAETCQNMPKHLAETDGN